LVSDTDDWDDGGGAGPSGVSPVFSEKRIVPIEAAMRLVTIKKEIYFNIKPPRSVLLSISHPILYRIKLGPALQRPLLY